MNSFGRILIGVIALALCGCLTFASFADARPRSPRPPVAGGGVAYPDPLPPPPIVIVPPGR